MTVKGALSYRYGSRAGALLVATAGLSVVLLAGCAPPGSEPSGEVAKGPAGEGAVEIVTVNSAFTPETLELNAGQKVTVEITNEDVVPHDFEIEVLDLSTGTIEAGEIATATFTVPEGTTEFACTYHSGMTGRIETS